MSGEQTIVELVTNPAQIDVVGAETVEIVTREGTQVVELEPDRVEVTDLDSPETVEMGIPGPKGDPGQGAATEYEVDSETAPAEEGPLALGYANEAGDDLTSDDDRHTPFAADRKGDVFTRSRRIEPAVDAFIGPYSLPVVGFRDTTGEVPLFTPDSGKRVRVRRVFLQAAFDMADGVGVEVVVKLGTTVIVQTDFIGSQPYADGVVKLGDPDAALTIELMADEKVYYNFSVDQVA